MTSETPFGVINPKDAMVNRVGHSPEFIDALAQEIRRVDGNHNLGAGALAEALMPFLAAVLATTPETAKPDTSEADGLRLKALLNGRDNFIVNEGLWSKFVATLPQKAAPATASSGGMVTPVAWRVRFPGGSDGWKLTYAPDRYGQEWEKEPVYSASTIEAALAEQKDAT